MLFSRKLCTILNVHFNRSQIEYNLRAQVIFTQDVQNSSMSRFFPHRWSWHFILFEGGFMSVFPTSLIHLHFYVPRQLLVNYLCLFAFRRGDPPATAHWARDTTMVCCLPLNSRGAVKKLTGILILLWRTITIAATQKLCSYRNITACRESWINPRFLA